MDEFQGGSGALPDRQHGLGVVQAQTLAALRIRPLALGKRLIVDPAAFLLKGRSGI